MSAQWFVITFSGVLLTGAAWAGQPSGGGGRDGNERWPDKLNEGDAAPDFTLKCPDEKTTFTLSAYKDKKPVVLIFGSFT